MLLIDDDANSDEVFEEKDEVDPNDEHQRKREARNDLQKVCILNKSKYVCIIGASSYKRMMSMIIFPPTSHQSELQITVMQPMVKGLKMRWILMISTNERER